MSSTPIYLIAKHVPDPMRNEPRNVGIVLWTQWGISARFLGEKSVGRWSTRIPDVAGNPTAFKQWANYWQTLVSREEIAFRGQRISSRDRAAMELLSLTGKESYFLADRGEVFEDIEQEAIPSLLDFLFQTLVTSDSDQQTLINSLQLEARCRRIISTIGLRKDPKFTERKSIMCRISSDVIEDIEFDYYYGTSEPERLAKRVPLGSPFNRNSADAAAWQLDRTIRSSIIQHDRVAALVLPPEDVELAEHAERSIRILREVAPVINLADDNAEEQLRSFFPVPVIAMIDRGKRPNSQDSPIYPIDLAT